MVGNGCTDARFDGNARVPFAVGKSLISTSLYRRVARACDGSYWDAEPGSRCACVCVCVCVRARTRARQLLAARVGLHACVVRRLTTPTPRACACACVRVRVCVCRRRCASLLAAVEEELSGLNIYNILADCEHEEEEEEEQQQQPALAAAQQHGQRQQRPAADRGPPGARTHSTAGASSSSSSSSSSGSGAAARRQRLAEALATHRQWPVTGAVRQGARVHNWATLVGHNPPCTVATWVVWRAARCVPCWRLVCALPPRPARAVPPAAPHTCAHTPLSSSHPNTHLLTHTQ
jgi:hypothetical protein